MTPKIMVVEDEKSIVLTLQRRLPRLGYDITACVSSGEEALEQARILPPDLVLMDMTLTGKMNGIQTASALRAELNIPSVYLTADSDPHTLQAAKLTHPLGYIIKPFGEDELHRTLELALQNHQMEKDLRASQQALEEFGKTLESRVRERTAELIQAKGALELSVRQKDVLLKEVHHRVKNNLQIISSLLRMQSRTSSDPQINDILQESQARVRSIAMVYELLHKSLDLSSISVKEYIQLLITQLLISYDKANSVHTTIEVEDVRLDLDKSVPCGLIITELITNSLKHGFPEGKKGAIRVSFKKTTNGSYLLSVIDEGVGIPVPVDWKHTSSMGFSIIRSLCDQLDGHVEMHRGENGGTVFTLSFS